MIFKVNFIKRGIPETVNNIHTFFKKSRGERKEWMTAFHPLCCKGWSNVFNSLHSLFIIAWTLSQISLCLINLFSLCIFQSKSHPYIQSTVALRFQRTDVAGQLALELLSWYQKELRNPRILWDQTPNVDENRLYQLIIVWFFFFFLAHRESGAVSFSLVNLDA